MSASVRFVHAEHCKLYYDQTANGIVYKKDINNRELVVFVELAKDVDIVGGMLQVWIEQGATRCVRAVGVEKDWTIYGLKKLAERKGRKLEGVTDKTNSHGASPPKTLCDLQWLNRGPCRHAILFGAFAR